MVSSRIGASRHVSVRIRASRDAVDAFARDVAAVQADLVRLKGLLEA